MTEYECYCGVTYDASTYLQVKRHMAAKIHQRWVTRRTR
jgi:hypothetical protein